MVLAAVAGTVFYHQRTIDMNEKTEGFIAELDARPFCCSPEVARKLLTMLLAHEADPDNPAKVPLRWHDAEITAHPRPDTVCCGKSGMWAMVLGGRPLRWDVVVVEELQPLTVLKNIRVRRKSSLTKFGVSDCSEQAVRSAIKIAAEKHNVNPDDIQWTLDNISEGVGDVHLMHVRQTPWGEWRQQQESPVAVS